MLFSLDLGNGVIPSAIVKTDRPINLIRAFSRGYLFVTGEESSEDLAIVDFDYFHELHFVSPSFERADIVPPEHEHETELDNSQAIPPFDAADSLDHEQHNDNVPLTPPTATAQDIVEESVSYESQSSPNWTLGTSGHDSLVSSSRKYISFR